MLAEAVELRLEKNRQGGRPLPEAKTAKLSFGQACAAYRNASER